MTHALLLALAMIAASATTPATSAAAAPASARRMDRPRAGSQAIKVSSPDGRVATVFWVDVDGAPGYQIDWNGRTVLAPSRLGLVRDDESFALGLRWLSTSRAERVEDRYELLTSKRRLNDYRANRVVCHLESAAHRKLDIVFQVSNDGVAFRYVFPDTSAEVRTIQEELTSFHFLPGTRAWLQPIAGARSGWQQSNPSFEEYYEQAIPVGTPAPFGNGWMYPGLFRSGDTWLLVSETAVGRHYSGTRLGTASPGGVYRVAFPDPRETIGTEPVAPHSTLPWRTPWRLVVVGGLKTIAESTLGTDLADPPAPVAMRAAPGAVPAPSALRTAPGAESTGVRAAPGSPTGAVADTPIVPGKASWSWPLLGDPNTTRAVQQQFVDYAAEMGWRYTLVDALWDTQIGYDSLQALVEYARPKGVRILVWYNSAGDWNTTPQTPRDRMLTHASRIAEFDRLQAIGVAGLKIDFFGGDGQAFVNYYQDILDDAAPYGFLMNFHGATLPRGWERTYPHLMTMEGVRGLESETFEQANADRAPQHETMLPFTRNVFDPMDFTPMVLDQLPRTQRRTTSAFELATAVLFTSGITHYAEVPAGMARVPDYVRAYIRGIPSVWDDVRFLDGYPGQYVVLARRAGSKWWIAGINGADTARTVTLDLRGLKAHGTGTLITDGDGGNLSFRRASLPADARALRITLQPRGGFAAVVQ